jgi:hypothetical protein
LAADLCDRGAAVDVWTRSRSSGKSNGKVDRVENLGKLTYAN